MKKKLFPSRNPIHELKIGQELFIYFKMYLPGNQVKTFTLIGKEEHCSNTLLLKCQEIIYSIQVSSETEIILLKAFDASLWKECLMPSEELWRTGQIVGVADSDDVINDDDSDLVDEINWDYSKHK